MIFKKIALLCILISLNTNAEELEPISYSYSNSCRTLIPLFLGNYAKEKLMVTAIEYPSHGGERAFMITRGWKDHDEINIYRFLAKESLYAKLNKNVNYRIKKNDFMISKATVSKKVLNKMIEVWYEPLKDLKIKHKKKKDYLKLDGAVYEFGVSYSITKFLRGQRRVHEEDESYRLINLSNNLFKLNDFTDSKIEKNLLKKGQ